jgi:Zn-dependent protease with chaperone function
MNLEKYEKLISDLEKKALANPNNYLKKVILITLLGFLVLGCALLLALIPLAILACLVIITIVTGGKALLILLKLGKLLILLLVPTWVMLKSSFNLLFTRFPAPTGTAIKRQDASHLFSQIDALRNKMNGPPIHHVLLTGEINAAIVQHPRFGLFGWEKNYLILGLPLLQVMSEPEAMAVIAHEYGHLSGHHSRFGGFIYRFRRAWAQLQAISESWQDWGSKLVAKLFRWYAPYFNAYTFVYARQNEYLADKHSVALVGSQPTANALMRCQIAAQFENDLFWPEINRIIINQAEPLSNKSHFWMQFMQERLDEKKRTEYLNAASKIITDHHDTHPSISDRLKAIGTNIDAGKALEINPLAQSAASVLLGNSLNAMCEKLDAEWKNNVSEQWREKHAYLQERKNKLLEIETKPELSEQDTWDKICIEEELAPDTNMLPIVQSFLDAHPEHLAARYRRGVLLLKDEDEAGIEDLEHVMKNDIEATLACCESAWRFYLNKNAEKAETYRARWIQHSDHLQAVQTEYANISPNDSVAEHQLDAETITKITHIINTNNKHINTVYLVRRVLKADETINTYVLCFETKWLNFGDKSAEIIQRLSQLEFPVSAHIVNLKHPSYSKMRKAVKNLKIQALYKA